MLAEISCGITRLRRAKGAFRAASVGRSRGCRNAPVLGGG